MTQRTVPVLLLIVMFVPVTTANAQLERQLADPGGAVDELFWAPSIVTLPTVTNVYPGNLNFTIHHSFGLVSGGVEELFGLDGAANIRFGFDYGVTENLSIGVGRERFDKVYDGRAKWNVFHQTTDGRIPFELAVAGDVGVTTLKNGLSFTDRLNYGAALLIARKVNDAVSIQVSPLVSHFNVVYRDLDRFGNPVERQNTHVAIGIGARWKVRARMALSVEYVPVVGARSDNTSDALSVGVDLNTFGHVFQMFFTSTQWMTMQHSAARNHDQFWDGDFRFGFMVNRVFNLTNDY